MNVRFVLGNGEIKFAKGSRCSAEDEAEGERRTGEGVKEEEQRPEMPSGRDVVVDDDVVR